MGATLAALLHELDPSLRLLMLERLEAPALESSAAVNNAGTGHAANLSELHAAAGWWHGRHRQGCGDQASFESSLEFWSSFRRRAAQHH